MRPFARTRAASIERADLVLFQGELRVLRPARPLRHLVAEDIAEALVFFLVGIRLWAIGKRHNFVTQIQFFRDRVESDRLGLLLSQVAEGPPKNCTISYEGDVAAKVNADAYGIGTFIAADAVGAGVGEVVLYATGSSARQTVRTDKRPCDAVIMAIVDQWDVDGETVFVK